MLVSYQQYSQYSYNGYSQPFNQPNAVQANNVASNSKVDQVEPSETTPKLLDGARNILNFIEQGIDSLKKDGASDADIAEKIQQATSGFLQGYQEASEELSATGLLDKVKSTVELLKEQVLDGIDQLKADLGLSQKETNEIVSELPAPVPKVLNYSSESFEGKSFVFQYFDIR